MRIECPYCGDRDSSEFAYRGQAVERPSDDQENGQKLSVSFTNGSVTGVVCA